MASTKKYYIFLFMVNSVTHQCASQCPDVSKLNVIPGYGWDSLTNTDTKQLFKLTYNQCKLTGDGKYLIPDEVEIDNTNKTEVHTMVINHWLNYSSPIATTFHQEPELFWPKKFLQLYYSFSEDYQEMKCLQVKHQAFTCRSLLTQTFYHVHLSASAQISTSLKAKFFDVMKALNSNQKDKAKYLIQSIVKHYGTHYVSNFDIGTVFIKDDYLRNDFLQERYNQSEELITESKLSLFETAKQSWTNEHHLSSPLLDEYNNAIVKTKIRLCDEVNFECTTPINRSVHFLSDLITTSNFPNTSNLILIKMKNLINDAIFHYFVENIHQGCTQPESPNFDYIANIDDGSCQRSIYFTFGGVYQNCDRQVNSVYVDNCSGPFVNNSLSGGIVCSAGFTNIHVYTKIVSNFNTEGGLVRLNTYSCISNSSIQGPSYQFGGLYSLDVDNIHTKGKSCPSFFKAIFIFDKKLAICVNSTNTESANKYALPFGGFASCSTEYQCPDGYKKYLAIRYDNDNIYYCLKKLNPDSYGIVPLLKRPPFLNTSEIIKMNDSVEDKNYEDNDKIKSNSIVNKNEYVIYIIMHFLIILFSKFF